MVTVAQNGTGYSPNNLGLIFPLPYCLDGSLVDLWARRLECPDPFNPAGSTHEELVCTHGSAALRPWFWILGSHSTDPLWIRAPLRRLLRRLCPIVLEQSLLALALLRAGPGRARARKDDAHDESSAVND